MKRAGNYSFSTDRLTGQVLTEQDSYSCNHCQRIILVKPRQKGEDVGGLCKVCMGLICPVCVGQMTCVTWEKQMEQIESRERFLRSAGLA